jgi:hypothetical protein
VDRQSRCWSCSTTRTANVDLAIEQTPAGGNEVHHVVGNVPLGTKFSYVISA